MQQKLSLFDILKQKGKCENNKQNIWIFGTLFIFGLIGLVVGILSDLMYVLVDPRIDFERREG